MTKVNLAQFRSSQWNVVLECRPAVAGVPVKQRNDSVQCRTSNVRSKPGRNDQMALIGRATREWTRLLQRRNDCIRGDSSLSSPIRAGREHQITGSARFPRNTVPKLSRLYQFTRRRVIIAVDVLVQQHTVFPSVLFRRNQTDCLIHHSPITPYLKVIPQ